MPLFDIAVNASNPQLIDRLTEIKSRSVAAGVDKWLLVGCDLESSQKVLQLSAATDDALGLFCTAGVHPHDAKSVPSDYLDQLRQLHQHPQVVAVGECGLDFNRDFSPRPVQEQIFSEQLALAVALGKAVYMHERDAAERFIGIYSTFASDIKRGVVHCFTADKNALKQYLDMGLSIGITGWVCDERRGQALRELIHYIPLDRLMLETDAPFLLPRNLVPKPKERRNEPTYLPHIAQTVAILLNLDLKCVADNSYRNSCRFFGIADREVQ